MEEQGLTDPSIRLTDKPDEVERLCSHHWLKAGERTSGRRRREGGRSAALTQLRQSLQSDIGLAAPVLTQLVGDVVSVSRFIEGEAKPQMFARFSLNAVPALAAIGGGHTADGDDGFRDLWEYLGENRDSDAGAM